MKKALIVMAIMAAFAAPAHAAYPWLDITRFFAEQPVYSEGDEWVPEPAPEFVLELAGGNYWTGGCRVTNWMGTMARRFSFFRV